MNRSHLNYFKELFEGRADVSWTAWFRQHEEELRKELPRAAFLRLKFKNLKEAEKYLQEAGVAYQRDPAAVRREEYYADFHPSVLDEKGRPRVEFLRQRYNGALGQVMDGDVAGAAAALQAVIQKIRRYPIARRQQELEDMCFDGERAMTAGGFAEARVLLEAVASVPEGDDLTDHAVRRAKEQLRQLSTVARNQIGGTQ